MHLFGLKGEIMKAHPYFLFGWLLAATVLLSLVGLTAVPVPAGQASATSIELLG
jgi:hypothetical protein